MRGETRLLLEEGFDLFLVRGILEEDLPRIFEEGFTGFNGHEHQKATGLGLYMTKQVLDSLSLDINIQSQIDQGTHVLITPKKR